jgi:hypothetical protein
MGSMNQEIVFTLIGGMGLFFLGMRMMSENLLISGISSLVVQPWGNVFRLLVSGFQV